MIKTLKNRFEINEREHFLKIDLQNVEYNGDEVIALVNFKLYNSEEDYLNGESNIDYLFATNKQTVTFAEVVGEEGAGFQNKLETAFLKESVGSKYLINGNEIIL